MPVPTRFAPLPRFPVYALEHWVGEDIQLDSVTLWRSPDAPGPVTRSIWLLHRSGAGRALTVGSFASDLDGSGDQDSGGRVDVAALEAASMLSAVTVPTNVTGPRDGALVESLGRYSLARGREWRTWPGATWHVDGQPTPAYVWEFAGAWAGVVAAPNGTALAVVGVGVASDDVRVVTLQDKLVYGPVVDGQFDRTVESLRHDWRATGMPIANQTGFHPRATCTAAQLGLNRSEHEISRRCLAESEVFIFIASSLLASDQPSFDVNKRCTLWWPTRLPDLLARALNVLTQSGRSQSLRRLPPSPGRPARRMRRRRVRPRPGRPAPDGRPGRTQQLVDVYVGCMTADDEEAAIQRTVGNVVVESKQRVEIGNLQRPDLNQVRVGARRFEISCHWSGRLSAHPSHRHARTRRKPR